ncbi:hypothetical protein GCM10010129_26920 [Streptomyces fumigatiscleroticus]|nr:hypothetical protein GCM10010129_26920 [Streptomyces fumigatiscleroticus]
MPGEAAPQRAQRGDAGEQVAEPEGAQHEQPGTVRTAAPRENTRRTPAGLPPATPRTTRQARTAPAATASMLRTGERKGGHDARTHRHGTPAATASMLRTGERKGGHDARTHRHGTPAATASMLRTGERKGGHDARTHRHGTPATVRTRTTQRVPARIGPAGRGHRHNTPATVRTRTTQRVPAHAVAAGNRSVPRHRRGSPAARGHRRGSPAVGSPAGRGHRRGAASAVRGRSGRWLPVRAVGAGGRGVPGHRAPSAARSRSAVEERPSR